MEINTLRPGLLVSLKTSVRGNIAYQTKSLDYAKTEAGVERARWETTRTIADAAEFDAAKTARSKMRTAIARVCAPTAFGLLCPEQDSATLQAAIDEARAVQDAFNATAKLTRIAVYVITGRVAADDVQAVRAINSEVRDLLDAMAEGINQLDVKKVRDAADKARSIGQMLVPETQARIQLAIEAARKSAREIVKAGENAAQAIDQRTLRVLTEARTAFLDVGETTEVAAPEAVGRAVDFDVSPCNVAAPAAAPRQVEI